MLELVEVFSDEHDAGLYFDQKCFLITLGSSVVNTLLMADFLMANAYFGSSLPEVIMNVVTTGVIQTKIKIVAKRSSQRIRFMVPEFFNRSLTDD